MAYSHWVLSTESTGKKQKQERIEDTSQQALQKRYANYWQQCWSYGDYYSSNTLATAQVPPQPTVA